MSEELPEGWAWVKAASLASGTSNALAIGPFGSNLKVSDYCERGVPLVFVRDIRAESFGGRGTKYVTGEKATELRSHLVRPGDLLVTKMGEPPGDTAIYPQGRPPGVITADCIKLTPNLSLTCAEFLKYCLRAEPVRSQIVEQTMGVAQQKLSLARFRDITIPLPPLPEQRRIVAKVEALFAQVNAARGRLAKVPLILKRFRQAVLEAACAGRLTNSSTDDGELPTGWRLVTLRDLVVPGGIFDGPFGSHLKSSDYTEAGVRVVRLENLAHLHFMEEKRTFISSVKYESLRKHTVAEGDILFGSFVEDSVRVCLLPKLTTPAIAKADCFCVRSSPDVVQREYLVLQLATRRTHDSLLEEVHGATRPRITTKQLRNVAVPVCSREEQRRIVSIVRRFFDLADVIERRVQATAANSNRLPQAILAKAFAGELVSREADLAGTDGRSYEPASALIERLTATRVECNRTSGRVRDVRRRPKRRPSATRQPRRAKSSTLGEPHAPR